jgi:hypothetical protein
MEIPKIKAPTSLYKWIWFVTVCVPLGLLKLSEDRAKGLQNRLDKCVENTAAVEELKRKSDSAVIYRLMDEAFRRSNENIVVPIVDSIKNKNL